MQPGANFAQIQATLPPWRSGQFAGSLPTLRTLQNIAARLRLDSFLADISTNSQALAAINNETASHPTLSGHPTLLLDNICAVIQHELLDNTLKRQSTRDRSALLRLLLRHEEVNLQRLKFQRLTVAQIDKWYWNGPGKEMLEEADDDYGEDRFDKIGELLYGKLWNSPPNRGPLTQTKHRPKSKSTPSAAAGASASNTGGVADSNSATALAGQRETSAKAPAKGAKAGLCS